MGQIVEDGSHSELLRLGGAYAQLLQAGGVSEAEAGALVDLATGAASQRGAETEAGTGAGVAQILLMDPE